MISRRCSCGWLCADEASLSQMPYVGRQRGMPGERDFVLRNCPRCRSTMAFDARIADAALQRDLATLARQAANDGNEPEFYSAMAATLERSAERKLRELDAEFGERLAEDEDDGTVWELLEPLRHRTSG